MLPTYETPANEKAEAEIADLFAAYFRATHIKFPVLARVDRLFSRGAIAFALGECKDRDNPFGSYDGGWNVSRAKVERLRYLRETLHVPTLFIVRFSCGTVAYIDASKQYKPIERWGRYDRGDDGDQEPGAQFDWKLLNKILGPSE